MVDLNTVFDSYHRRYEDIFRNFYPSKNGTGFQERNQTVNFANAYEAEAHKQGKDCFVWYELQFGENNRKHLDALIVNQSCKQIFFVEAKRFTELKKVQSVRRDINRINGKIGSKENGILSDLRIEDSGHGERIPGINGYECHGLILADIWAYNDDKKAILKTFNQHCFLSYFSNPQNAFGDGKEHCTDECVPVDIVDADLTYYVKSFNIGVEQCKWIDEEYKLLGFSWKIK